MKIAEPFRAMSLFTLFVHRSSTYAFSVSRKSLPAAALRGWSLSTLASSVVDDAPTEDQSAAANSRAPFRMPRQSANDSSYSSESGDDESKWNKLGLWTELTECIDQELKLEAPTAVQALVLPKLLQTTETAQHVAFLAATGSGKTLAYALPVMQMLKHHEVFGEVKRYKQRPRAVILAPTRELAAQITSVLKQLSHSIKLSVRAVTGNDSVHKQRKYLTAREVDILVATPGRLIQHVNDRTVLLNKCKFVVLDEMDTMIEQGFGSELARLLHPVLYHKNSGTPDPEVDLVESAPSVWLTSATMTQSIQKMIGDTSDTVNAKRHYVKKTGEEEKPTTGLVLPRMEVVRAPGLHKVVPKLEQVFVDVGNVNKLSLLVDLVCSESDKQTLIFCNTANSCRAVEYALSEARQSCLSYHGDLNSIARAENFDKFRKGTSQLLVCTDLAARGLDVPTVQHVIMFDFPLNALDYLHRSGRTARGMNAGKVTAMVTKRDQVLAMAIERAVQRGESLDGLSSRKSDYQLGGRLHTRGTKSPSSTKKKTIRLGGDRTKRPSSRGAPARRQRR